MATKKPAAAPAPAAKPAAKKTGTAVAVKKSSGGLVDIKAQMAAELANLSNRTAPAGGNKIQIKEKMFHLPDGSQSDELQVVIVDFMAVNMFYEAAYNAKQIVPPSCFAIGSTPTALVPSSNAPLLQSDACSSCPMNQFGSAGDGKACKNMRRLAVLPPDADDDTPLWILDVSPTGLKSFDGYVRSTAAKLGVAPIGVITTIKFDPNVTYGSLRFSDPQPNENLETHWGRKAEALDLLTQEPDVSGYVAAPPARGARKVVAGKR